MHGITRSQNLRDKENPDAAGHVNLITIRYADGRTLRFRADAGRESFSEDDTRLLAETLSKASSTAEWANIDNRPSL